MKLLILFTLLFSFSGFSSELVFKLNGKVVKKISRKQATSGKIQFKEATVGSIDKTIFNVFRGYERTYRGYSFYELMDSVYGESWRNAKTISFLALDGYKQIANIKRMLKASKGKRGYIAYQEAGKSGFTEVHKKGKVINPGPYYLVWSNFTEKDKANHGDDLKWPYQLNIVDIKTTLK